MLSVKQDIALNLAVLLILGSVITTLSMLTPASTGIGTHMQLIPVPCLFYLVFRVPCPSCGLTTSLVYLLHGQFGESFKAHPLGLVVLTGLIIIVVMSIVGLFTGRAWWNIVGKRWFQNLILCGMVLYLGIWVIRLMI